MKEKWKGHINHETGAIQTLKSHVVNVADLSKAMLEDVSLGNMAYLCGLLHDMGKTCEEFQAHLLVQDNNRIDHAVVGAKYIYQEKYIYQDMNKSQLIVATTKQLLSMVILSHHTGLENFVNDSGISKYLERLNKEIEHFDEAKTSYLKDIYDEKAIQQILEQCYHEFETTYQRIISEYQGIESSKEMIRFELHLLGRLLFSALIDADRVDSETYEQGYSPPQIDISDIWKQAYDCVMNHFSTFTQMSKVNSLRSEISNQCDDAGNRSQGVYELSVPTGGGKTLASLRFALPHAMTHPNIKHIYYVIPYNTILNQNAKTIKEILCNEKGISEDLFLLHNSTVIPSDNDLYRQHTERWDCPIIMTTTVQFLNTLFNERKQDARRMHELCNSIIIFDEVQCLPEKVLSMFNTAVNFLHHTCHSTILLCTATQPNLHKMVKPVLLSDNASLIPNYEYYYEELKRVKLINRYQRGGYKLQEFCEFSCEQIAKHGSGLIVMNTKKQAQNVYEYIKEAVCDHTNVYHLSTSMCLAHRQDILNEAVEKLNDQQPVVMISTNLIEAGVDISFPMAIRAMSGMDNAIQVAGRVNRNGEMEDKAPVYIINICDVDEKLDRLLSIKLKKECMINFLDEYEKDSEKFENDLLSLKSLETYYDRYHSKLREKLIVDYEYGKNQSTLYELLSSNLKGVSGYRELTAQAYPLNMSFAYQQAGHEFQVIDQNTQDIIVPYERGEEIISTLMSGNLDEKTLKTVLKEAQSYTVSLYENQIDDLGSHITKMLDYGVMTLNDSNYQKNLGVVLNEECLGIFV